jgi:hypothetical protein
LPLHDKFGQKVTAEPFRYNHGLSGKKSHICALSAAGRPYMPERQHPINDLWLTKK